MSIKSPCVSTTTFTEDFLIFKEMIEKNLFLEWAQFAGNYYGTPLSSVNEKIKKGFTVLLEIEVEGARQIKTKLPNTLSIL